MGPTVAARPTSGNGTQLPVDTPTSLGRPTRDEAIGHLRAQAVKSSAAARELGRLAVLGEAAEKASECDASHIDKTEVERILVLLTWDTVNIYLRGEFVRELSLRHGVRAEGEVDAILEQIRDHLNRTQAESIEPVSIQARGSAA